jgi:aromatic ring-opening dioxygenase catalytic subunit (LigB family)
VGDDQQEVFDASNQPSMAIFWGERWETGTMEGAPPGEFFEAVKTGYAMDAVHKFDGHPALALDAIRGLVAREFDVASVASTPPGHGFGHAYGFIIQRLLGERTDIPVVPVMLNTYYPPNQPSAKRCFDFGGALRAAIEASPVEARVVLVASGGLSHFVVDEELDRRVLDGIAHRDAESLRSIPDHLLNAGSSEIRNWVAVAGAMHDREVAWSEYAPCYRTAAGTGCGMGFLRWR